MIKESDYLEWIIDAIPADWMSESMIQQNRHSLNEISHESAMKLIQITLDKGYNLKHVYLDTVGPPQSYEQKLMNRFMGYDVKFIVAKKADALYPVVSAASICAKVTRDDILENWYFIENHLKHLNPKTTTQQNQDKNDNDDCKQLEINDVIDTDNDEDEDEDIDIDINIETIKNKKEEKKKDKNKNDDSEGYWLGNGYPGHEKTKQFMQNYCDKIFGFPSIVRFSWQTAKTIIDERCAKTTFSDETAVNNLSRWGFNAGGKVKRSKFYKQNNLDLCFENPF